MLSFGFRSHWFSMDVYTSSLLAEDIFCDVTCIPSTLGGLKERLTAGNLWPKRLQICFLLPSFLIFWPFTGCWVEEQFLPLQLPMHQISGGPSNDQFLFLQFPVYVCCRQWPVPNWTKTCVGVNQVMRWMLEFLIRKPREVSCDSIGCLVVPTHSGSKRWGQRITPVVSNFLAMTSWWGNPRNCGGIQFFCYITICWRGCGKKYLRWKIWWTTR